MSAEGKKKRGESGSANAKNIPFRYGGSKCDYSTKLGHTTHPRLGGSKFLNAMKLGLLLDGFNPSDRAVRAADENIDLCPSVSDEKSHRSSKKHRSGKTKSDIVIRLGSKCEIQAGENSPIDISSAFEFRTVGNVHGLIRPTKDNDRAASLLILNCQDRGMFNHEEKNA